MEKILVDYGFLGIAVIGLCTYIMILHKSARDDQKVAREERKEWQGIAKDGHEAIRQHTDVLSRLTTLLETTREKIH